MRIGIAIASTVTRWEPLVSGPLIRRVIAIAPIADELNMRHDTSAADPSERSARRHSGSPVYDCEARFGPSKATLTKKYITGQSLEVLEVDTTITKPVLPIGGNRE